jgi:hypothetical protein
MFRYGPKEPLQNRRAEWLAFRFCSFYFAADRLWKTLGFYQESAILCNRVDNSLAIPKALTAFIESGFWPRNNAEAMRQNLHCLVAKASGLRGRT